MGLRQERLGLQPPLLLVAGLLLAASSAINYPEDPHAEPVPKKDLDHGADDLAMGQTHLFMVVGGLLLVVYLAVMWIIISSSNERKRLLEKKK